MPEPMVSPEEGINPDQEALLADSVGLALLVVLDTLSPTERVAFVLHDMFAVPFDEIAPIVGRSPTAARQLASDGVSVGAAGMIQGSLGPQTSSCGSLRVSTTCASEVEFSSMRTIVNELGATLQTG